MPTYTYRCKSCKNQFDEFQGIMEDCIKVCPSCGDDKGSLVRIIGSGVAPQFKGSGFYTTDYKGKQ